VFRDLVIARVVEPTVGACASAGGPGLAAVRQGKSVLECVHVVLDEEWAHHGFCVRDLDLLGCPSPSAVPKQEASAEH
jgi:hypothetical protein